MKKIMPIIVFLLTFGAFHSYAQDIPTLNIMTENWKPYQFQEDGKLKGVAVDLLVVMLNRIGSKQGLKDFKVYPWARSYSIVQKEKNSVLFSTTRTQEREKLFKWVGPIFTNTTCVIALKSKKIKISSKKDLLKFKYGTVIDDVGEQLLQRDGVPLSKMERNRRSPMNIKKLKRGRIDAVPQSFQGFSEEAKTIGFSPDDFECVYELNKSEISYAFNKQTSDSLIKKLQKALDQIRKEGILESLNKKYKK